MRTTIDLEDNLFARVKKLMSRRGVTLRSLVEESLRRLVEEDQKRVPFKLRDASFKGPRGFAPGAGPDDIAGALRAINDERSRP